MLLLVGRGLSPPLAFADGTSELEEIIVLAPKIKGSVSALIESRREASSVTDGLGAEQMSRAGDSDAAASLRRVTGLTLMNGKYVYVRGLGERYSGVRMNGFSLPSPEPARRVVPLDLFPTAMLESVVVQKSFTPDQPGEFGGGLIQLQTKSLPERPFFRASVSTTYDAPSDRLTYSGGSTDWAGIDDGTRQLPAALKSALASGRKLIPIQPGSSEGLPIEELTTLGRSLPNIYSTAKSNEPALPSLTFSGGNRFRLGAFSAGLTGSLLYGQSAQSGDRLQKGYNIGSEQKLVTDYSENSRFSEVETRVAAGVDIGLSYKKNNQWILSSQLLRHTTDFVQERVRRTAATPTSAEESTTLEWTERELWAHHLKGRHIMPGLFSQPSEVTWRAGVADAGRASPDRRDYTYERTPESYQLRGDSGGNRRTYSELNDQSAELGVDVSLPLSANADRLKIKMGLSHVTRERRSDVFRLYFQRDSSAPPGIDAGAPLEEQLAPDQIGPGYYMLQNLTDAADSYSGRQTLEAQYLVAEFMPTPALSLQAGARREVSKQKVATFAYYAPAEPFAESELIMSDILPAYSFTYKPNDRIRSRTAYSETLARPDFRELSTTGFIDDETGYEVQGNANLKGTVIRNVDHRWEYYLTTDEYASLGGFYKHFENPIEVMFVPGVNKIQTFDNAAGAENYGLEAEGRFGLRNLTRTLRRWSALGNYTWIHSRIELDERNKGIQTSATRPLQGQSPFTANFQLQYDRELWGLSGTLVYNIIGPRITEVGTNQVPDTYEQSFQQLDLVLSKRFARNWTVGVRGKNLLDPLVEARQGGEIVRQFRRGRSAGVSLNAIF